MKRWRSKGKDYAQVATAFEFIRMVRLPQVASSRRRGGLRMGRSASAMSKGIWPAFAEEADWHGTAERVRRRTTEWGGAT